MERPRRVGDAAVEREHQAEGELRDGDRVLPGAVGDEDASTARGLEIDGVHPGPGADDEPEPTARRERRLRDLRGAYDEDLGVTRGQGLGQLIGLEARLKVYLVTRALEVVKVPWLSLSAIRICMGDLVRGWGAYREARWARVVARVVAPKAPRIGDSPAKTLCETGARRPQDVPMGGARAAARGRL